MVFYFKSSQSTGNCLIYMGEDQLENDKLLDAYLPNDVWFHVDSISSAHVYLELPQQGDKDKSINIIKINIDEVPEALLDQCTQLVKANSIKGSKMATVDVVYTLASNLKKTSDMAAGQVGFVDYKQVRHIRNVSKNVDILVQLNPSKTQVLFEIHFNRRQKSELDRRRALAIEKKEQRIREAKRKEEEELLSYDRLMQSENLVSNKQSEIKMDFYIPPQQQTTQYPGFYVPTTVNDSNDQHQRYSGLNANQSKDYLDERPLLEELGIDLTLIKCRTFAILNPFSNRTGGIDKDLTGPLLFLIIFAFSLLVFLHKPHFGYVYGFSVLGSGLIYILLRLMAGHSSRQVDLSFVLSVLGYSLLPIILLCLVIRCVDVITILFKIHHSAMLKYIASMCFVYWASNSASRYFVDQINGIDKRALILYPCILFYAVFSFLILF
ncbi:hypothetical protein GJ496_010932 [Pomphorhynchus laevis]|nr:hypothetical protein GJ496_010932 [Pomphorhynchus laevis]